MDPLFFQSVVVPAVIVLLGLYLAVRVARLQARLQILESKWLLLSKTLAGQNKSADFVDVAASFKPRASAIDEPAVVSFASQQPPQAQAQQTPRPILADAMVTCSDQAQIAEPEEAGQSIAPPNVVPGSYWDSSPAAVREPRPRQHAQFEASIARPKMPGAEWEAFIGGNWLNKVGVLLILVGLAIFLSYSLMQLGALGRVLTGYAVSALMLGCGLALQNRPTFRIFAKGLIAGGWSGAYFTTYAMHALEAARIIEDPILATTLLFVVPLAMVSHACWQRWEAGATLAFLYATLAIVLSPPYLFAGIALLPLLIGLLMVAYRFSWNSSAAVAVVALYGALTWEFSEGVRSAPPMAEPLLLFVCWLVFELFDILVVIRRHPGGGLGRVLFPLNTCGLLGALHLTWPYGTSYALAYSVSAGLFLGSALIRGRCRPADGSVEKDNPLWHGYLGGYELSVTVAACLAAAALMVHFDGLRLTAALLFQYELIFLLGYSLSQKYLRALASLLSIVVVGRLMLQIFSLAEGMRVLDHTLNAATPLAILLVATLYFNRYMIRLNWNDVWLRLETLYGMAATTLLGVLTSLEFPLQSVGTCVLILAFLLLQIGLFKSAWDFRFQAYALACVGFAYMLLVNGLMLFTADVEAPATYWRWLAPAAAFFGIATIELLRRDFHLGLAQQTAIQHGALIGTLTLLDFLLWHLLPAPLIALSWAAVTLVLFEAGFQLRLPMLRGYGCVMALLTFGRLFLSNFINAGATFGISHRLLSVLPITLLFYFWSHRSKLAAQQSGSGDWERYWSRLSLYLGTLLGVLLIRFEMGRVLATVGWAVFMLALYTLGEWRRNEDLRWQSYLLGLLTLSRCWATNFFIPESLAGAFGRVTSGSLVAAGFFAAMLLSKLQSRSTTSLAPGHKLTLSYIDQHSASYFSIAGGFLVALLIFYEVSGRMLTAAWSIEAAILLAVGLAIRDTWLRLFSLGLFGICIVKVFVYDIAALSTPYRILSFVLLGVLLVGASWIYTRFRARIVSHLGT